MNIAVLACGSFWEPQDAFSKLNGVLETEVGYTGGTSSNPTYHNIGDHCEAVKITFDARAVAYEELLRVFWKLHDPTAEYETKYASIIFYTDEMQRQLAKESLRQAQLGYEESILTKIEPATMFYRAESYHQRYLAKLRGEI